MKTATMTINLYNFDELSESAQQRAISDHREWMLCDMTVSDFEGCGDPELDTPESMYEEGYNYILFEDEGVIDSIRANEYLFYASGETASITIQWNGSAARSKSFLKIAGTQVEIDDVPRREIVSA